jgi:hypothetical protein
MKAIRLVYSFSDFDHYHHQATILFGLLPHACQIVNHQYCMEECRLLEATNNVWLFDNARRTCSVPLLSCSATCLMDEAVAEAEGGKLPGTSGCEHSLRFLIESTRQQAREIAAAERAGESPGAVTPSQRSLRMTLQLLRSLTGTDGPPGEQERWTNRLTVQMLAKVGMVDLLLSLLKVGRASCHLLVCKTNSNEGIVILKTARSTHGMQSSYAVLQKVVALWRRLKW